MLAAGDAVLMTTPAGGGFGKPQRGVGLPPLTTMPGRRHSPHPISRYLLMGQKLMLRLVVPAG